MVSERQEIQKNIEKAIRNVGVEEGDILLVHSDITPVIKLADLKRWEKESKSLDQNFAKFLISKSSELLKQSFLNVLGPKGTLIVPTFNYDFCKGKPYCHKTSESQVGLFSNYILFDKSSTRSFHTIMPFAAIGVAIEEIFSNLSKSAVGKGSVFHKLHQVNAKILCFNVNFRQCTFLHYIEQSRNSEYRYLKHFRGLVRREEEEYEDSFDFYVRRYLVEEVDLELNRLEGDLLSARKMNKVILAGKYPLLCTQAVDFYDTAVEKLNVDPYYLLSGSPEGKYVLHD